MNLFLQSLPLGTYFNIFRFGFTYACLYPVRSQ